MLTKPSSAGAGAAGLFAFSIPAELGALLDQSATARVRFWRLDDAERVGFVRFIEQSETPSLREQRAMVIAQSLLGEACAVRVSSRSWQI